MYLRQRGNPPPTVVQAHSGVAYLSVTHKLLAFQALRLGTNTACRYTEYGSVISRSFSVPAKADVDYILSFYIACPSLYSAGFNVYASTSVSGSTIKLNGSGGTKLGAFNNPSEYKQITARIKSTQDFDNIKLFFFSGGSTVPFFIDDLAIFEDNGLPLCTDKTPSSPLPDPEPGVCYKNYVRDPGFEAGDATSSPWESGSQHQQDPGAGVNAHSGDWLS